MNSIIRASNIAEIVKSLDTDNSIYDYKRDIREKADDLRKEFMSKVKNTKLKIVKA